MALRKSSRVSQWLTQIIFSLSNVGFEQRAFWPVFYFIGPLLVEYLPLYSASQARCHEVKPGFTGWAQVNGRNTISWEEKFILDIWYIDNRSLWLDLKILWLTIKMVLVRNRIIAQGYATMPKFTGSETKLTDDYR